MKQCETNISHVIKNNIEGTLNLVNVIEEFQIKFKKKNKTYLYFFGLIMTLNERKLWRTIRVRPIQCLWLD